MNNLLKIIFLDIDGVLNGYADTDLIENTFSKYKLDLFKQLYDSLDNVLVVITSNRRTLKAYPFKTPSMSKNIILSKLFILL